MLPMVILATLARVIASQAVISGASSVAPVARQSMRLGHLPCMRIVRTSHRERGQIYVPFTNLMLFLAVMALVMGFGSSSNLAAACGIAVTLTMMIDTHLVAFVMLRVRRWSPRVALPLVRVLIVSVVPEEIPFVPVACTGSGAGTKGSRPDRRPESRC